MQNSTYGATDRATQARLPNGSLGATWRVAGLFMAQLCWRMSWEPAERAERVGVSDGGGAPVRAPPFALRPGAGPRGVQDAGAPPLTTRADDPLSDLCKEDAPNHSRTGVYHTWLDARRSVSVKRFSHAPRYWQVTDNPTAGWC